MGWGLGSGSITSIITFFCWFPWSNMFHYLSSSSVADGTWPTGEKAAVTILTIKGPRKAVFWCKGTLKINPIMKVLCISWPLNLIKCHYHESKYVYEGRNACRSGWISSACFNLEIRMRTAAEANGEWGAFSPSIRPQWKCHANVRPWNVESCRPKGCCFPFTPSRKLAVKGSFIFGDSNWKFFQVSYLVDTHTDMNFLLRVSVTHRPAFARLILGRWKERSLQMKLPSLPVLQGIYPDQPKDSEIHFFNKKEWVIKEWPMCNRAITVSSFLFTGQQTIHSFNTGNIFCNLFSGNSSHSDCHSSNIYLFVCDFRSENGMSSTKMSPSRASLAAESAAEFPLMPKWLGIQIKTNSLPSLVISVYNYKIWTKTGWSYFRFNIDCNNERESDSIKNIFLSNNKHVWELKE